MKTQFVIQLTFNNKDWVYYGCPCDNLNIAKSVEEKIRKELSYNQKMVQKFPNQVWPMIGVKDIRIVKQTITEIVMP